MKVTYSRINSTSVLLKVSEVEEQNRPEGVLIISLDTSISMRCNGFNNCVSMVRTILAGSSMEKIFTTYDVSFTKRSVESLSSLTPNGGGTHFRELFFGLAKVVNDLPNKPVTLVVFTDGEDNGGNYSTAYEFLRQALSNRVSRVHAVGIETSSDTNMLTKISRLGTVDGTYGFFTRALESSTIETDRLLSELNCNTTVTIGSHIVPITNGVGRLVFENQSMQVEPAGSEDLLDVFSILFDMYARDGFTRDNITVLSTVLNDARTRLKGLQPMKRSELGKLIEANTGSIKSAYECLGAPKTSEKYRNIVLEARNARTSKLNRKLDERLLQNDSIRIKEDEYIDNLAQNYRDKDLSSLSNHKCFLSTSSLDELLPEGDCLCIGLEVERNANGVLDPSLLKIQRVSPSYISAQQCLEFAEWNLTHFTTLQDETRAAINAGIPVIFSEDDLSMVRQYLRRTVGYLYGEDPLIGTSRHIIFAYLKVLQYIDNSNDNSEWMLVRKNLILNTFLKVFNFYPDILTNPGDFEKSIENRKKDKVPDLNLQILAWKYLDLSCDQFYIDEEEFRRSDKRALDRNSLLELGSVDVNEWITNFITAKTPNMRNGIIFEDIKCELIKAGVPEEKVNARISNDSNNNCVRAVKTFKNVNEYRLKLSPILQIPNIDDIKILASRVQILLDTQYIDFNVSDSGVANDYLVSKIVAAISEERSNRLTQVKQMLGANKTDSNIANFITSSDIVEQAAILLGDFYFGINATKYLLACTDASQLSLILKGLRITDVFPDLPENFTGKYIALHGDRFISRDEYNRINAHMMNSNNEAYEKSSSHNKNIRNGVWQPSRKLFNKILRGPIKMSEEQAVELFSHLSEEYIRKRFNN